MKLSKEDMERVDNLRGSMAASQTGVAFLIGCIDKLCPKPERFTYAMRDCANCDGSGNVSAAMSSLDCDVENCPMCGGLGKTRVKVKRTAHSV